MVTKTLMQIHAVDTLYHSFHYIYYDLLVTLCCSVHVIDALSVYNQRLTTAHANTITLEHTMKILLSNDDGVNAPGLRALYMVLSRIEDAEVYVVAPDTERSGFSSAITITRPLHISQMSNGFYAVNGTPADCVYLACNGFFDHAFDLVVSGINSGANLGDDVIYSGTVGAAMEGRLMAMPAIATSLVGASVRQYQDPEKYAVAANWIKDFIQSGLPTMPSKHILNVNIPDTNQLAGAKVTRMGSRKAANPVMQSQDPRGKPVYWIGLSGEEMPSQGAMDVMTDFEAVSQNYVSVTPVQMDVTSYTQIDQLKGHGLLD